MARLLTALWATLLALPVAADNDATAATRALVRQMASLSEDYSQPGPYRSAWNGTRVVNELDDLLCTPRQNLTTGGTAIKLGGHERVVAHFAPLLKAVDALPAGDIRFLDVRAIHMETRLEHLSPVRDLGRLLRVDAVLATRDGDRARALRRIAQTFRLARGVERDRILISRLVADAMRIRACILLSRWLRAGLVDPAATRTLLARQIEDRPTLAHIYAGERLTQRNSFRRLDDTVRDQLTHALTSKRTGGDGKIDEAQLRKHFQTDAFRLALGASLEHHASLVNDEIARGFANGDVEGLRRFGRALDDRMARLKPTIESRTRALVKVLRSLGTRPWPAEQVEELRSWLVDTMALSVVLGHASVMPRLLERSLANRTRLHATAVEAALAAHRASSGKYPATLAALKLPAAWTRDPFADGDLRYRVRPGGYDLYSVGTDGRDDGGVGAHDPTPDDAPDLVFAGGRQR